MSKQFTIITKDGNEWTTKHGQNNAAEGGAGRRKGND